MCAEKRSGNQLKARKPFPFAVIAAVYLLGLLIGGLYVGIVAPLRTVIQADFGISSQRGIWIINIYTMFYASTIPLSGNLADRYGRSKIFVRCLILFALGSLMCACSQYANSFLLLLSGRIVQALGAGGIIPVASAEMGVSAPESSRGMWLGMAAAVSGLANVIGAALGSAAVSLMGTQYWALIFWAAVPLALLLALCAWVVFPCTEQRKQEKLDVAGSLVFIGAMLCTLLALNGIDFSHLGKSLFSFSVWPFLLLAWLLFVCFFYLEQRAQDPLFHTEFFQNRQVVIVMIISLLVGGIIISMTLVPEFAEVVLGAPVGTGGYYMAVIGIFAIVGPLLCGKLVDAFGPKKPLMAGLVIMVVGYLFLALFVVRFPSVAGMLIGLAVVGLGMGFSMGTPLNYMILQNTSPEKSTTAVASIALVRQMGTTIAPALLTSCCALHSAALVHAGYALMMIMVALLGILSLIALSFYREVKAKC